MTFRQLIVFQILCVVQTLLKIANTINERPTALGMGKPEQGKQRGGG